MAESETQLDFENQMFIELLSEDGLIITARGLGLDRLMLKFLKLYSDPHNLVLVLNTSSAQEKYFVEELSRENIEHLPKSITNEYSIKERDILYMKGGVLFITSRILVVDLLRRQCPVDKVAGLLVFNAHRVTDSSTEAFILRLYRQDNKTGFIKAFSDAPEPFTNGFCQLERVMRNLFVRNVYLWPRFHATVGASMSRHKPDVVELRQQMTPSMTAIQMAVLDIIKACVTELKTANPALDTDEVTVENSMSKSFDQVIRMQLDPVWNQLGSKTKQLVFDLRMLRTLLFFLTQYDCVTFYSYLESVRSNTESRAFSSHSTWAFMDATNMLFLKARERVYGVSKLNKTSTAQKDSSKAETESDPNQGLQLEESPKWHLLTMVLEEIHQESRKNTAMEGGGRVLVVANDERTCYQLREYLCKGGTNLLQRQFERLLASKQLKRPPEGVSAFQTEGVQLFKGKKRTLASDQSGKRKERNAAKKRRYENQTSTTFPLEAEDKGESSQEEPEDLDMGKTDEEDFLRELQMIELMYGDDGAMRVAPQPEEGEFGILSKSAVVLHALNSSNNPYHLTKVLRELRPRYIIMYDADVEFVRQVEVFKASNPGMPVRVYFLLYESSVEEQKYLTSLRKEKEAFQQLIKDRAHMVVPVDREGKVVDSTLLRRDSAVSASLEPAGNTRKAGGRTQDRGPQTVLVDIREFRSSLPSLLHKSGIDIIPLTLEVGDYVLTPDVCVERKSVSDLIGSLNSGRLYNQATAMTRHYKRPVLLIEFEESKSFSLQSASALQSEISYNSISSKLVLLTLHFPSLRILWCPSSYATAELFKELKSGQPQPEPDIAVTVGQDTLSKVEGITYSAAVQDFLLKLPGINSKNYRYIMEKVKDLQELVSLSQEELEEILGNDTNAKLLWNFLHSELEVTPNSRSRSVRIP